VWSPAALALLDRHRWPGNIRELKNAVECAVVLCTGDALEVEHLPDAVRGELAESQPPGEEATLRSRLADLDRHRIAEALERAGGNQSRAARALGIARNTLIARMKAYGLDARRGGP
jgi:DNA-binding NtrC family response regulator